MSTAQPIDVRDMAIVHRTFRNVYEESARLGRQHNNANVISLGERMISTETALRIVSIWLETAFEGGRHQRRIELIDSVA